MQDKGSTTKDSHGPQGLRYLDFGPPTKIVPPNKVVAMASGGASHDVRYVSNGQGTHDHDRQELPRRMWQLQPLPGIALPVGGAQNLAWAGPQSARQPNLKKLAPLPRKVIGSSCSRSQPDMDQGMRSLNSQHYACKDMKQNFHPDQDVKTTLTGLRLQQERSEEWSNSELEFSSRSRGQFRRRKERRTVWPDPLKYNSRTLMFFGLDHSVRQMAIKGIEWKWWDRVVMILIFLNSVMLALHDPFDIPSLKPKSAKRDAIDATGKVFSVFFLFECLVKILAFGFVRGRNAYMSTYWNWLDFFIVIIGIIDLFPGESSNLSSLRSFRVLRPLRLVNKFPDLRDTVEILLLVLPSLSNAVVLVLMELLIFGILGVQLFAGALRGGCFNVNTGHVRDSPSPCGFLTCGPQAECLQLVANPSQGVVSFDTIGSAMMSAFQVMTYEGWSDIMYAVQDGWSPYSYLYFILIILAGPIFALQLFLVVISTKYHTVKIKQAADLTNKADKLECQRAAKTKAEKRARQALRAVGPPPPRASPQGTDEEMHGQRSNRVAPLAPLASASPPACPPDVAGEQCSNRGAAVSESQSPGQQRSNRVDELDQGKAALAAGGATAGQSASRLTRELSVSQKAQHLLEDLALSDTLLNLNMAMICLNMLVMAADANVNLCELDDPSPYAVFHKSSDLFYSRAEEKHSWPVNHSVTGFKAVTEGSNIFFAGVFLLDLLVKVAGLGPRKLFLGGVSSLWNVFDVLIVALSVSEVKSVYENTKCFSEAQTCFAAEQCGAASGFSLLRVFRLARLGKLLRKIPDVYHQLVALGKSVAAVGALLTLILLFMLIFVVLGMSVFGGVMTIEYDAHELMLGSHVYVEVPLDAWRDRRPVSMPGRRGIIVDVDAEMRPLTPWKVVVWNAEGLQQQLGLDQDSAVWASDGHALVSNSSMITAIVPRLNYDDFFSAIITTFQILTTEAWNDTMYDAVGSTGDVKAVIFFYAIIVVGNWILLNMFIAIIIERFAEQRKVAFNAAYLNMKQQFVERFAGMPRQRLKAELSRLFDEVDKNCSGFIDKVELQHLLIHNLHLDLGEAQFLRIYNKYDRDRSGEIDKSEFYFFVTELLEESMREVGSQKNAMSKAADGLQSETFTSSFRSSYSSGSSSIQGSRYRVAEGLHHEREDAQSSESMRLDNDANHQLQPNATAEANKNVLQTRSQVPPRSFCDGCREASSNRFKPRVFCSLLVSNKWFERVILFCIVYSSITLALDAPLLPDDHQLRFFLAASDYIMNFCFVVECIAKIIAQGPSVYLSCRWNRLDFLIVITAIADMILSAMLEGQGVNLAFLKAVRILRALRPLRLISRAKGLRLIIDAMFRSVRPILATVSIALSTYALLGLIGMQILLGKMGSCSDNKIRYMRDCWGVNEQGEDRQWVEYSIKFDSMPESLLSMFSLATLDDWPAHMFAAVDAVGQKWQTEGTKYAGQFEHESALQNAHPEVFFFYCACILIGGYIVMNMFVSVFVDAYSCASEEMKGENEKRKTEGSLKATIKRATLPDRDDITRTWLRKNMDETFNNQRWDIFSSLLIVINITVMACGSWKQSNWQLELLSFASVFFPLVFGFESMCKLHAFGPRRYFDQNWNKFDFFIVNTDFCWVIIDNLDSDVSLDPSILRALRVARVARILRVFRLFKAARGLQIIVKSLVGSLPALVNVGTILLLVFFIFAALATSLFGTMCVDGEVALGGMGAVRCMLMGDNVLGLHANFRNVGESFQSLLRCSTGDAWREVLNVIMTPPADNKKPITSMEWNRLTRTLGYDPKTLAPQDPRYNSQLVGEYGRMEMVKIALRGWNASVYGLENDPDWPSPESVPAAEEWIKIAQLSLVGCLTEEHVEMLESEGLIDCSQVSQNALANDAPHPRRNNPCQPTCAVGGQVNYVIASLFFAAFILVTSFVVLQLVIGVLIEQLVINEDDSHNQNQVKAENCTVLTLGVLHRISRRFRHQSLHRYLHRQQRSASQYKCD